MNISCINEAMNCRKSITPEKGMLGTEFVGSDRYEVVCVKVLSPKKVYVLKIDDPKKKVVNGVEYYDGDVDVLFENAKPKLKHYTDPKSGSLIHNAIEMHTWDMDRFERGITYSLRKNGRWMPKGAGAWDVGAVHFGHAEHYWDPSF